MNNKFHNRQSLVILFSN